VKYKDQEVKYIITFSDSGEREQTIIDGFKPDEEGYYLYDGPFAAFLLNKPITGELRISDGVNTRLLACVNGTHYENIMYDSMEIVVPIEDIIGIITERGYTGYQAGPIITSEQDKKRIWTDGFMEYVYDNVQEDK